MSVLVLFAQIVDKELVWFNLFILDPQFMANYYHHHRQTIEKKLDDKNDIKLLDLKEFVSNNNMRNRTGNFHLHIEKLLKLIDA